LIIERTAVELIAATALARVAGRPRDTQVVLTASVALVRGFDPASATLEVADTDAAFSVEVSAFGVALAAGLAVAVAGLAVAVAGLSVAVAGLAVAVAGLSVAVAGLSVAVADLGTVTVAVAGLGIR